jgi:glycosyltransferase involved in cell wall biosynthesis
MRLLLFDQFSHLGGAQQNLLELLPAMQRQGWELMAALPGSGAVFERLRALRLPVAHLRCGPYRMGSKSATDAGRFLFDTPLLVRQVARIAGEFHPDVLYVNGPRLLPAVALAKLRAPVVFHAHSYVSSPAARRLVAASIAWARCCVIACCEFVAQPWRRFARSVTVIYNGVSGPPSNRPPCEKRDFVIGCIGRLAPEKGQLDFLKAAARIHRETGNCRFRIYGAPLFGATELAHYESELRRQALGQPVEFLGWTDDVYAALSEMDLVLVPSARYEATTRVILEAFSCGVPVIGYRSGGIPEVIDHGANGFLAESEQEMAAYAIELVRDPVRRARMSAQACAAWRRRFTLDHYRKRILEALAHCAER